MRAHARLIGARGRVHSERPGSRGGQKYYRFPCACVCKCVWTAEGIAEISQGVMTSCSQLFRESWATGVDLLSGGLGSDVVLRGFGAGYY